MAIVRSLSETGLASLREFLTLVKQEPSAHPPLHLLDDETASEPLRWRIEVEPRPFATRLEAGQYLYDRIRAAEAIAVENETGMWAWLALFYFDTLCPEQRGRRAPGEVARWIPDKRRFFRHLLAAPWAIYRAYAANPAQAMIVLCQPPHRPGRYCENLAARKDLLTSPAVVGAATRLYYDPANGRVRRLGHSVQPGNFARFLAVVGQLDVTFDLYSLTAEALLWRLPREEFSSARLHDKRAEATATPLPLELL